MLDPILIPPPNRPSERTAQEIREDLSKSLIEATQSLELTEKLLILAADCHVEAIKTYGNALGAYSVAMRPDPVDDDD